MAGNAEAVTVVRDLSKFNALLQHSVDALFVVEFGTAHIAAVNDVACDVLHIPRQVLLSKSLEEIVDPATWREVARLRSKGSSPPSGSSLRLNGVLIGDADIETPVEIHLSLDRVGPALYIIVTSRDIAERKRTEAGLRRSERVYRLLTENLFGFIWSMDRDLRYTYLSPSVKSVLGYSEKEARELAIEDLYTPDSLEAARKTFSGYEDDSGKDAKRRRKRKRPELGELRTVELEARRKDGVTIWLEITLAPFRARGTQALGYMGISRDVTERKHEQAELNRQKTLLEAIFKDVPDAMVIADSNREILMTNPGFSRTFGYDFSEVDGESAVVLYADVSDFEFQGGVRFNLSAEETREPYLCQFVRKDATVFPGEAVGTVIRDFSGNKLGYLSVIRDITERVRAHEALQAGRAMLADAQRIAHLGSWSWKVSEDKLTWSDETYRIFGLEIGDFEGTNDSFFAKVHEDDREGVIAAVEVSRTEGVPIDIEHRIIRPDGKVRIVHERGEVTVDENGEVTDVFGTVFDVTEAKKSEEERRKLEIQIQQTQKLESLGVLAGGIAHDFNNLLTGIQGYASLAARALDEGSVARRHLIEIDKVAVRASDLTKQMLAYSGKGKFVIQPLQLTTVVKDLTELLKVSISKKAELITEFDNELPWVEADATQLQQVVMNLITNSSDALGDEPGSITIRTGTMEADEEYLKGTYLEEKPEPGTYAYFEVADTGCGMDEETLAKIFDPFFTTKFTGRGLGLAAVLGIVRGHSGAVKISSAPGEGTTTTILLPCMEQDSIPSSVRVSESKSDLSSWRGSGTVLVVDDEEIVRNLAQSILEDAGFSVLTATDGRDCLTVFSEYSQEIRAVLLDLTMPHMDGEETFVELRRMKDDLRIILSSGYNEDEVVQRFDGKNLAGFVQKPYQANDLLTEIKAVLEI